MTISLAQMTPHVKRALGNYTDIDDLIVDWLNQTQRSYATALNIRELEVTARMTFNLAQADPSVYAPPSDWWAPELMYNITANPPMEVKLRPLTKILEMSPLPANRPFMYGIRGNSFIFRPQPNAAEVVEHTYRFRPPEMTSTVGLTLPDEFMFAVIFDAISRGLRINGDDDRAETFDGWRNDELQKLGDQRGEEYLAQLASVELRTASQGLTQRWP